MLTKEAYLSLKKELTFKRNYVFSFLVILFDGMMFMVCLHLANQTDWFLYSLSQVAMALIFFHHFSILHDCGHGSCASSNWLNTITGHYASLFCFLPYFPWKYIHQEHHTWSGNIEKDPVLKNLKDWREKGSAPLLVRFAWKSWVPLAGLFQHFVFWGYPIVLMRKGELKGRIFWNSLFSVFWMFSIYIALFITFPQWFHFSSFFVAIIIYLIMVECVNLPHHTGMPTYNQKLLYREQVKVTRSCYYPIMLSELLVLNFNFHIEHHLFPTLPWYRLRKARQIIKPALGSDYNEEVGIEWNIKHRSKSINLLLE